jgi:hypothetical protein
MRGSDERSGDLLSYVDLEDRVRAASARLIRRIVNEVLFALDSEVSKLYVDTGRPSIPPERLLRALLLQAFTRSAPRRRNWQPTASVAEAA